jgi:hypothetical protein
LSSCSWLDRASEEARQRYTPPAAAPSGPARRALAQHRKAADELARLDQEQRSTQLERDAVDLEPPPAGVLARRRHRRQRDRVAAEYDRFVAEAAGRRRGLLALQVEARTIIGTVTSAELDAADVRSRSPKPRRLPPTRSSGVPSANSRACALLFATRGLMALRPRAIGGSSPDACSTTSRGGTSSCRS